MTNNTKELLPCPFCGGEAYFCNYSYHPDTWYVTCKEADDFRDKASCKTLAVTADCTSKEEAAKLWNTRHLASMGDGWLPIESAPKDGTRVLIVLAECNQEKWVDISRYGKEKPFGCHTNWQNAYGQGYSWNPTHWQPLPQPPENS